MRSQLTRIAVAFFFALSFTAGAAHLAACASIKKGARTARDIANEACAVFAEARETELGMSAEKWCALHANLAPFIDFILSTEQKAGLRRAPDESADSPNPSHTSGTDPTGEGPTGETGAPTGSTGETGPS